MGRRWTDCDNTDAGLRRLALQLAVQLPVDHTEADQVIEYCRELVRWRQSGAVISAPELAVSCDLRQKIVLVQDS